MSDPLSPARGILIGLVLGALLWAGAIFTATWLISRGAEKAVQTCATSVFDPYAIRDGAQVVRCP